VIFLLLHPVLQDPVHQHLVKKIRYLQVIPKRFLFWDCKGNKILVFSGILNVVS